MGRKPVEIIDGMKKCPHCQCELPVEMFEKNKHTSSGLMSWCIDCKRAAKSISGQPRGYGSLLRNTLLGKEAKRNRTKAAARQSRIKELGIDLVEVLESLDDY